MQDLKIETYEFTITPLQITNKTNALSPSPKKSLVIKLGESVAKTSQLRTPLTLVTEVLYSEANRKYCPLKGIIKIYDAIDEENQIISCIGSFQADQILQNGGGVQVISKNIGATMLKMEVGGKLLGKGSEGKSKEKQSEKVKEKESESESISVVSSQNMMCGLDGSERIVKQDEMTKEEFNKLGGIRRVNTLNLGMAYNSTDITDLKGGINLGFSKLLANRQQQQNSINKLQAKAKAMVIKKSSIPEDLSSFNNGLMNDSKYNTAAPGKQIKIQQKYSLDQSSKQDKNFLQPGGPQKSATNMSDLNLELESNFSNEELNENNFLQAPPFLAFPKSIGGQSSQNSNSASHSQSHSNSRTITINNPNANRDQIEEIRSMSILDDKPSQASKQVSNSINFVNSMELNAFQVKNCINTSSARRISNGNNEELSNSNASVATSMMSYPEVFQEYQKNQMEVLGEMLVEERRKNLLYEQKIEKFHMKLIASKQKYMDLWQNWEKWCQCGMHFLENLQRDESGHYIVEVLNQKDSIGLKYTLNEQSQAIFTNFLSLTIENCSQFGQEGSRHGNSDLLFPRSRVTSELSEINSPELQRVLEKIEVTYASNTKLQKINRELELKVQQLLVSAKKVELTALQFQKQKQRLSELCNDQQKQIHYLQTQIQSLTDINSYLKEKDAQMESIIQFKEENLQNLRKKMEESNTEMDKLEDEILNCKKNTDNKELMLEEMREELEDKEELIQAYREKYGDIKILYKSRDKIDSYISLCVQSILEANAPAKEESHSQPLI